jgi:hypothetical protein
MTAVAGSPAQAPHVCAFELRHHSYACRRLPSIIHRGVTMRLLALFSIAIVAVSFPVFAADPPATFPAVADLPIQKELPDPLTFRDRRKVTTPEQWKQRREEMKAILQEYEYGHMPPPPGNVQGKEVASKLLADGKTQYRLMHLTFGPGEKLGFDMAIFSPPSDTAKPPFPTIISLTYAAGENSARQYQAALARGYAIAAIPYQQLGADNPNYRKSAFFPAYPDYDWNDIAAWAWGLSRAVDFLQTDPATDKAKIAAVGVSRTAQAVLLAGAFDERIALVAPVGGGGALRFSGKGRGGKQGIDEIVDQNTYWFGPKFPEFKGNTDKLPCDQHWLPALTAPRPFILCNALDDQYGNAFACLQSYLGAKPIYELLGSPDNLGLNFRPGQHGMNATDWSALLDFADLHFKNISPNRRFDQYPPPDQLH